MKNIDTLDVQFCVKPSVKELIKCRLFPDDNTRYGVGGTYFGHHVSEPYSFQYICRGYYLIVTVEHKAMEGIETAEELQDKVIQMVVDYFHISQDDIVIYGTQMLDKLVVKKRKVLKNTASNRKYIKVKHIGWKIKNKINITRKFRLDIQSYRKGRKKKIRLCLGSISKQSDLVEINRIEFKNDYKLKVYDEQLAAQDIFRIAADSSNGYTKTLERYTTRTNCTYSSKSNTSVAITCYFKEYERLEDGDIVGAERYKGILRTEVKLKNKHLNYKKKHNNIDKTLVNYFKKEVAQNYFNQYVKPIFYTERFYRLDIAQLKIYKNELLKDFEKDRLYEFLVKINKFGITEVKDKYDDDTFKEYIKKIRKIGVNPLCFSPVIDGKEITIEKMDNFTLLQNGIDSDI